MPTQPQHREGSSNLLILLEFIAKHYVIVAFLFAFMASTMSTFLQKFQVEDECHGVINQFLDVVYNGTFTSEIRLQALSSAGNITVSCYSRTSTGLALLSKLVGIFV